MFSCLGEFSMLQYSAAAQFRCPDVLQAGQMIGARSDFVPEGICAQLRKLQDKVPPMSPSETQEILKRQLNVSSLLDVFEWIELENPLGSASIAQVRNIPPVVFHSSPLCP
jgi:hypothetical protein